MSLGLSQQTWLSCLSLHSDPLFSARECSLSPSGVAGVRGGQSTQATPLLETDPCLHCTSCASHVQLQKVLTLCVKKKRKKALRGWKFTPPPQSNQSTATMQNKRASSSSSSSSGDSQESKWAKALRIWRVRRAAKFPTPGAWEARLLEDAPRGS